MTHRRLWTMLACLFLLSYVSCAPVPFFGHEKPLTEILPQLALEDVPTYIANDTKISNRTNCIRYGYTIGRPVEPMVHGFWGYVLNKTYLINFISRNPTLLHWGLLVSEEPPVYDSENGELPPPQTRVPHPETGILFDLRNSEIDGPNTGTTLDVLDWSTYAFHNDALITYLGTLNHTDAELINIGRTYIRHIIKEGFHFLYRNCQIFTSWYTKALWPEMKMTPTARIDQQAGKLIWWFRDWGKSLRLMGAKIIGWTGYKISNVGNVDSPVEFMDLDTLTNLDSKSVV